MNANEWIEQFTGLKVADGAASGTDPEGATQALEQELALKQTLLAEAYQRVLPLKAEFQQAMASEVKIKGKYFKQRMLEVNGTQIDEAEFEEIDFSAVKLEPETQAIITRGSNLIQMQGESLARTTYVRNGETGALFEPAELEDGYWFPLTRERILPETYVGALYSKTQRMIDETNEALMAGTEVKREKGELTPNANRARDLVRSGAELLTIGADMAGAFGGDTDGAKLAVTVLTVMAKVVDGGGEVYDKVKAREYADASSTVLGTMKLLTSTILKGAGIDPAIVAATEKGFAVGGAAITAGKHFARGIDGAADGTSVLGGVLQSALEIAAGQVTNKETQRALQIAAVSTGTAFKGAGTSVKLLQSLDAGDPVGVVDCLGSFAATALSGVQDLRKIEATYGKSKGSAEQTAKAIDEQTKAIQQNIELGTLAGKTTAAMAISLKRGNYQQAFDTLVNAIGDGLSKALIAAKLPEDQARKIGILYKSAASSVTALEAMMAEDPNVEGALRALGSGISTAFEAAAPGNQAMQLAAKGISAGFGGLADAAKVRRLYSEGLYDEGVLAFTDGVRAQIGNAFALKDLAGGKKDGEDPGGDASKLKEALLGLTSTVDGAKELIAAKIDDALEKQVADETKAEAEQEAQAILAEARADISDAEQFGRDAADIDKLIAKMQRDQMIMKVAVQVMEGGAAFLATFIPALGAASAAIKMMASMVAAAQRAQQLAYWVQSQSDLAAAQSPLSSSAQNFVNNQAEQFAHHAIQAAFAAAELIGNVLETVGAATYGAAEAAGMGLKVAAKAGAKIENIIRNHKRVEELEYAWRITKRALKNPTNRKLGLRARQLNPTLAKYSIAWGAVKLKDPLARAALRACDLTEAVLENENANVDKVVEYLETFYEEDDKLYRVLEEAADWVPADLTLTLRCWVKLKNGAVKSIKLQNPDTGVIDGYLAQLKGDLNTFGTGELVQHVGLLQDIDRALAAWVPQAPNQKHVEQVQTALTILRKQAAAAIKAAEDRRAALAQARQKIDQTLRQERLQALTQETFVLGELQTAIAGVESIEDDDDPADMHDEFDRAGELLKEIAGVDVLQQNKVVQSFVKQLDGKLKDLERLIDSAELQAV